jgi:hypothetical protein
MSVFFVTAFLVLLLLPLPEEIILRRIVLVGMMVAAAFIGWAVADIEFEVPEASPEAEDPAPPPEPQQEEADTAPPPLAKGAMPDWFLGLNNVMRTALVLGLFFIAFNSVTLVLWDRSLILALFAGILSIPSTTVMGIYEFYFRDGLPEGKRERYWSPRLFREGMVIFKSRWGARIDAMSQEEFAWHVFKVKAGIIPPLCALMAAFLLIALSMFAGLPWQWVPIGFVAVWIAVTAPLLLSYLFSNTEPPKEERPPPLEEPRPLIFRERLGDRLRSIIFEGEGKYPLPPDEVFDTVLAVGEEIYNEPRQAPPLLAQQRPSLEGDEQRAWDAAYAEWKHDYALLYEAVVQSLSAYLSHLPRFVDAPFKVPFSELRIDGALLNGITRPFTFNEELKARGLAQGLRDAYYANVGEYTYSVKKATDALYPQHYQGKPDEIVDTYFRNTPFRVLFDVLVPYNPFSEEQRCTHQWCMGDTGSGKSTYLRHQLRADMLAAARGECSLIVVDSKKLIREMRKLKEFGPGGELYGKLLLIDKDTPFPLNPFARQGTGAEHHHLHALRGHAEAATGRAGALRRRRAPEPGQEPGYPAEVHPHGQERPAALRDTGRGAAGLVARHAARRRPPHHSRRGAAPRQLHAAGARVPSHEDAEGGQLGPRPRQ